MRLVALVDAAPLLQEESFDIGFATHGHDVVSLADEALKRLTRTLPLTSWSLLRSRTKRHESEKENRWYTSVHGRLARLRLDPRVTMSFVVWFLGANVQPTGKPGSRDDENDMNRPA